MLMKYSQNKYIFNAMTVNIQMINKHIICLKIIYYNFKLLDPNSATKTNNHVHVTNILYLSCTYEIKYKTITFTTNGFALVHTLPHQHMHSKLQQIKGSIVY
jgi:hypothetical protein